MRYKINYFRTAHEVIEADYLLMPEGMLVFKKEGTAYKLPAPNERDYGIVRSYPIVVKVVAAGVWETVELLNEEGV